MLICYQLWLMKMHIQSGPKIGTIYLYALTLPILTDFQNYSTVRIRRKVVIILLATLL